MPTFKQSLVWFRRDLRLTDHAALSAALSQSTHVLCCFILDTDILSPLQQIGVSTDRRIDFILASLQEMDATLRRHGSQLIVLLGTPQDCIPTLVQQTGIQAVFTNHDYEPDAIARDDTVGQRLAKAGCAFFTFKDQVVLEKNDVLTQAGHPFSVFTPYKRAWFNQLQLHEHTLLSPHLTEDKFDRFATPPAALQQPVPSTTDIGFSPSNLAQLPIPAGEEGARELLADFQERIGKYDTQRDFPAIKGPSYLSFHLRFGTISIRTLVRMALDMIRAGQHSTGAQTWLSELVWREFYFMILWHHPHVVTHAFKPAYDAISWATGPDADTLFTAWCEGKTGYPLVDAAMRQLLHTGYMHNRLRMVTASFLTKDLGIDWRRGEAFFARHLNDFDLSANNGGWQWAASTGCDAQPYFRIFNPITQSQKFDPAGKFIRRYLPQLASLPDKAIHAPWQYPALLQDQGIKLGTDYPAPIVEHAQARQATLARYGVAIKTTP